MLSILFIILTVIFWIIVGIAGLFLLFFIGLLAPYLGQFAMGVLVLPLVWPGVVLYIIKREDLLKPVMTVYALLLTAGFVYWGLYT